MKKNERLSIQQIREKIKANDYTSEDVTEWRADERKGVQLLIRSLDKQEEKKQALLHQFNTMSIYENNLKQHGSLLIAGIDEAGRGPLAGPVVAAAVILPEDCRLYGLTDSKQLTESERNYFYDQIKAIALSYRIEMVSSEVIDEINIYQATKRAMMQSVMRLHVQPDHVLIDAVPLDIEVPTTVLEKGDQKSISIAAASVLAKVARDRYMSKLDDEFPVYQFAKHKGYGTRVHLDMLRTHGAISEHRKTFAPVQQVIEAN